MRTYLRTSFIRFCIGLMLFSLFFYGGMLSFPEYRKLIAWTVLYSFGLAPVLSIWFTARISAYVMRFVWLISTIDIGIRGFLRLYFGITPGPIEIFGTLFTTSHQESKEFLFAEWHLLLWVCVVSISILAITFIAEILLFKHKQFSFVLTRSVKITSYSCFVLFCLAFLNPAMRGTNNFLYWICSYHEYQKRQSELAQFEQSMTVTPDQLQQIQYVGENKRTVILIIGESLTRKAMSLYGYERQTNPLLEKQHDLMVFNDVVSGSYITAGAIPKLLSRANIDNDKDWRNSPSVLVQAKAAGYKTFWISNQLTFDGVVSALSHQADVQKFDNIGNDIAESTYDEVLFPDIQKALADTASQKFIVIHLLGNHMHYNLRYPASYQHFDQADDLITQQLKLAGRSERLIEKRNFYDNSVLYNDMIIDHVLTALKQQSQQTPAAFVYLSDHGQEIGDNRDYIGHSASDKEGWEIPLIMWSNQPILLNKANVEDRPYQTDRFDATMLDLLKIVSPYYDETDDILSPAFIAKDRYIADKIYQK